MRLIMRNGVLVLLSALLVSGCGKPAGSGGVAVVDLDKVAGAMGWLDEISKDLQAADAQLRTQLGEVMKRSQQTVEAAKTKVAAEARLSAEQTRALMTVKEDRELAALPLTRQQREALQAAVTQANTAWRAALNESQQVSQRQRMGLVHAYRERVRPIAMQAAATRGLNVVLTVSDNLLGYEPSCDISDQVVAELKKLPPPARVGLPASTTTPNPRPSAK